MRRMLLASAILFLSSFMTGCSSSCTVTIQSCTLAIYDVTGRDNSDYQITFTNGTRHVRTYTIANCKKATLWAETPVNCF